MSRFLLYPLPDDEVITLHVLRMSLLLSLMDGIEGFSWRTTDDHLVVDSLKREGDALTRIEKFDYNRDLVGQREILNAIGSVCGSPIDNAAIAGRFSVIFYDQRLCDVVVSGGVDNSHLDVSFTFASRLRSLTKQQLLMCFPQSTAAAEGKNWGFGEGRAYYRM